MAWQNFMHTAEENKIRDDALEEAACMADAKVYTEYSDDDLSWQAKSIADDIRALKNKVS